jgi:hypothetical protein
MSQKGEKSSDSTGEWRARTGTHHQIDTGQLRALDGMCGAEEAVAGTDPYNRTTPAPQHRSEKSGRRLLDDMRRLSDAIKKSPHWTRRQK